jgi:S1-C subfamily serine protease
VLYRHSLVRQVKAATLQAHGGAVLRKAWIRYAALIAGLAAIASVSLVVAWPWAYGHVVVKMLLPGLEAEFGFHGGWIRPVKLEYSVYGVASVVPGGRLEQAGVRAGDVPVYGAVSLYEALEDVREGRVGRLNVVAATGDWPRDREAVREIRLAPR